MFHRYYWQTAKHILIAETKFAFMSKSTLDVKLITNSAFILSIFEYELDKKQT